MEQVTDTVSRENYADLVAQREARGWASATPQRIIKLDLPIINIETTDDQGHRIVTQRVTDAPLERLYKQGSLGSDEEKANARYEVGQKLFSYWYFGELYPLASRDYRKPYVGASDRFALMPAAERREHCRRKWREADAMFRSYGPKGLSHDRIGIVTHYVVIDEKPLAEVGYLVTEGRRKDVAQTRAIALEYLIDGLDRLVALWS